MPAPPPVRADYPRAVGGRRWRPSGLAIPADAPTAPAVTATSWLVADLNSGEVLGGCGPHEHRTPASVQKLLLAAALMPRLDPNRMVEVSRADLQLSRSGQFPDGGGRGRPVLDREPVVGLLLRSGNDAANVLARVGGGAAGRQGGVQAMNDEAHRLRAYQTHAATPSGLDGPGQYTSAYDLALIARATFAREDFRRYVATTVAQIPAQPGNRHSRSPTTTRCWANTQERSAERRASPTWPGNVRRRGRTQRPTTRGDLARSGDRTAGEFGGGDSTTGLGLRSSSRRLRRPPRHTRRDEV